jgi:hypothetical protein
MLGEVGEVLKDGQDRRGTNERRQSLTDFWVEGKDE